MMPKEQAEFNYITTIENVKETALFGTADLAFWRAHLESQNLFPFDANGKAQILISATQFVWSGILTHEFVVSLSISTSADARHVGAAYLIQAFNSSRMLAFAERVFFQTPYEWGKTESVDQVPASIDFADGNGAMFHAHMAGAPVRLRGEDEMVQGAIYLPQSNNLFYAKLGGYTETFAFSPTDEIEIKPSPRSPVFQSLIDSQFVPHEWRLRRQATHARSKTYKRS